MTGTIQTLRVDKGFGFIKDDTTRVLDNAALTTDCAWRFARYLAIHFANGALIDNAALDPQAPELLIYEQRGGRLRPSTGRRKTRGVSLFIALDVTKHQRGCG